MFFCVTSSQCGTWHGVFFQRYRLDNPPPCPDSVRLGLVRMRRLLPNDYGMHDHQYALANPPPLRHPNKIKFIQVRMCKACDVAYRGQVTSKPESFSEYTSECLAEIGKIGDWLVAEGYCQQTYSFPLCDNETLDPVGNPIEGGSSLGVARSFSLEGLGNRQTDRTDFRRRAGVGGGAGEDDGACRCTQAPEECVCRDQAWANRNKMG